MAEATRMPGLLRKASGTFWIEILANFILPYLIYVKAESHIGQVHALMFATLPPIVWTLIEFARKRRVDALSLLVIGGIALSLLAFIGGGSVRFLQLREQLVTGVVALVFLGSAAIGHPLIYQLARASSMRNSPSEAERLEKLRDNRYFRRTMTLMTLVWGFGLLLETVIACLLVFRLSIQDFLIVSPIIGYGTMGGLGLWTFWYAMRQRKRGEAARAAAGIQ